MSSNAKVLESPSTDPSRFTEWNRRFARALCLMESASDRAAAALVDALCSLSPNASGGIWVYQRGSLPRKIYTTVEATTDAERQLERDYIEGMHVLDPVYTAVRAGFSGCAGIRELMPEGFDTSEYWARFYAQVDTADSLLHIVRDPGGGRAVQLALWRSTEFGALTEAERANHRAVYPAVAAAVLRFAEFTDDPERPDLAARIESVLASFGVDCLTEREREIVSLILHGHNTESIANQLELASDTIRLHRHHAYAKLQVSSQGELYHRFLSSIR